MKERNYELDRKNTTTTERTVCMEFSDIVHRVQRTIVLLAGDPMCAFAKIDRDLHNVNFVTTSICLNTRHWNTFLFEESYRIARWTKSHKTFYIDKLGWWLHCSRRTWQQTHLKTKPNTKRSGIFVRYCCQVNWMKQYLFSHSLWICNVRKMYRLRKSRDDRIR